MAPVLNGPFADGVAQAGGNVDVSVKWYDGHFYVLAGNKTASEQQATITMKCVGNAKVTVLNENRQITLTAGAYTDKFADGNSVHIYRIDGGSSCGAY